MNINWVGFRSSPKPPVGAQKLSIESELEPRLNIGQALQLFTTSSGLSSWLAPVAKLDARQGGAITFSDEPEASGAFSMLNIPKRVVLVTQKLGGLDASFRERAELPGQASVRLKLTVTKFVLPEEQDEWRQNVSAALSRLKVACEEEPL